MKIDETMAQAIISEVTTEVKEAKNPSHGTEFCETCRILSAVGDSDILTDYLTRASGVFLVRNFPEASDPVGLTERIAPDLISALKALFLIGYKYGRRETQEELLTKWQEGYSEGLAVVPDGVVFECPGCGAEVEVDLRCARCRGELPPDLSAQMKALEADVKDVELLGAKCEGKLELLGDLRDCGLISQEVLEKMVLQARSYLDHLPRRPPKE